MSRAVLPRPAEQRSDVEAALRSVLSGEVTTDPVMLHLYSRDASMYAIEPLAVAFPRDGDDVEALVKCAVERELPLIARGAGTSLAGQAIGKGIVVDFSRHMRSIVSLDAHTLTARVQPGLVQDELNAAAGKHGLMFGADTSTSNRATLGGMIGNNSSGTNSLRYGTTVDQVVSLDVVLSDGTSAHLGLGTFDVPPARGTRLAQICLDLPKITARYRSAIAERFPSYWRHSGGYRLPELLEPDVSQPNLARFLVGSEGTLALVTEAEVRLVRQPRARTMAVGHFESVPAALAATQDALECSAVAVELMDRTILDLARTQHEYSGFSALIEGSPGALLFVTFMADSDAEAGDSARRLAARWRADKHGYHTLLATSPEMQAAVLKARKSSLGLLMATSVGTSRPLAFVEDTAVPPDVLEEYVERFAEILSRHGLRAGFYGHCAVGCLHIRPFVDVTVPSEEAAMAAAASEVVDLVVEFAGVNSSEHGDGLVRSPFNRRFFGSELYAAMDEVKRLFDPGRLLNPGKIVGAAEMTNDLRDRDLPSGAPIEGVIDFGAGGLRAAADRCMNIGACRKRDAGVMCPSYMATGREEHSTRGRANALVHALSSPNSLQDLAGRRLHEILDLCLECKACSSECPLSVDMAAMKSEFLHHYQATNGTPLRSRLFGAPRLLGRIGSAAAPLSNTIASASPLRWLLDRYVGVTKKRPLPRYERQTLFKWSAKRRPPARSSPASAPEVVFLADSFTSFSEPRIGQAAIELLEGAGWQVHFEGSSCCGRASISKGLLDRARVDAVRLVERLFPYADCGVPIVGIEPSCLFTVRDDLPRLLGRSSKSVAVAAQVRSVADLLVDAIDAGSISVGAVDDGAATTILHQPHCHERAAGSSGATLALLRRIPGVEVTELDCGCCGMAGSFGFESEHYPLSMDIGELRLFPRLRSADSSALVTASGVSCRQQIAHGASRTAAHPIELIRSVATFPGNGAHTSSATHDGKG